MKDEFLSEKVDPVAAVILKELPLSVTGDEYSTLITVGRSRCARDIMFLEESLNSIGIAVQAVPNCDDSDHDAAPLNLLADLPVSEYKFNFMHGHQHTH